MIDASLQLSGQQITVFILFYFKWPVFLSVIIYSLRMLFKDTRLKALPFYLDILCRYAFLY